MEQEVDDPILAKLNSKKNVQTTDDPILQKLNDPKKKSGLQSPPEAGQQVSPQTSTQEPNYAQLQFDNFVKGLTQEGLSKIEAFKKSNNIIAPDQNAINADAQKAWNETANQLLPPLKENYDKWEKSRLTYYQGRANQGENPDQLEKQFKDEQLLAQENFINKPLSLANEKWAKEYKSPKVEEYNSKLKLVEDYAKQIDSEINKKAEDRIKTIQNFNTELAKFEERALIRQYPVVGELKNEFTKSVDKLKDQSKLRIEEFKSDNPNASEYEIQKFTAKENKNLDEAIEPAYQKYRGAVSQIQRDPDFAKGFTESYKKETFKTQFPITEAIRKGIGQMLFDVIPGGISSSVAGSMDIDFDEHLRSKGTTKPQRTPFTKDEAKKQYIEKVGKKQYDEEKQKWVERQVEIKENLSKYSQEQAGEAAGYLHQLPATWAEAKQKGALGISEYISKNTGGVVGLAAPAVVAGLINPYLGVSVMGASSAAIEKGEAFDRGVEMLQENTGLSRKELYEKDLDSLLRDTSTQSGLINGSLEFISSISMVGRFLPKGTFPKMLSRVLKNSAIQIPASTLIEGSTEWVQAIDTDYAALKGQVDKDGKPIYTDKQIMDILEKNIDEGAYDEDFIGGATGAIGLGGFGGVRSGVRGQIRKEKLANIKLERSQRPLQNEKPQEPSGEVGGQGAVQQNATQENIQAQEKEKTMTIKGLEDLTNQIKQANEKTTPVIEPKVDESKLSSIEVKAQRNEIKETIHSIAAEAGIDINTEEFKAKSKEITGRSHLDKMNTKNLALMLDYVQGEKEFNEGTNLLDQYEEERQKEGLLSPEQPDVVAGQSTAISETPKQQSYGSRSEEKSLRGEKTEKVKSPKTGGTKVSPVTPQQAKIEDSKVNRKALQQGQKVGAEKLQGGQLVDENGNTIKPFDNKSKKSIKYKVGDSLITLPGNPKTRLQAQRTIEIMQAGAGIKVEISPKVKPSIRQNVFNKYDVAVGDVKGALLKFFAQGGFLNAKEAKGRAGLKESMIGWIADTGTTYDELAQLVSEETGIPLEQVDNGNFKDIIDDILTRPKSDVFKQLDLYLEKGQAKQLNQSFYDDSGNFDDKAFLEAIKEDTESVKELLGITSSEEFNVLIRKAQEAVKDASEKAQFINYLESLSNEQLDQLYYEQQDAFAGGEDQAIGEPSTGKETEVTTPQRGPDSPAKGAGQRGLAERIKSQVRSLRSAKTRAEKVKIAQQILKDTGTYLLNREGVITGTDASFADKNSPTFFDLIDERKSVYLLDKTSKIAETKEDYQKINAKLKDKVTIVNGSLMFDEAFSNGAVQAAKDLGYDAIRLTEIDGTNSTLQILNFDKLTHISGKDFVAERAKPKGPYQIEAEARVKKAEESVKSATEAYENKKKQLGKSLAQDQMDLLGNRIGDNGKLFQEGAADREAAKRQLESLKKNIDTAKQELDKANNALKVASKADETTLFESKNDRANDLLAEGFSDLADVLGAKKNISGNQAKLNDALVKIGKGLILKGEATVENVIEKIKELLKSKGITVSEDQLKSIKAEIKKQTAPKKKKKKRAKKASPKKKSVFKHVDFARAEILKTFGENYTPQSNEETKNLTDNFIKEMGGLNEAFAAKDLVHPAVKAILYAEKLDALRNEMDTNKDAMAEYMQYMNELEVMSREGGQAIQILDYIYQNYGMMFTAETQIKKFKEANNGHIPAEMAAKFKELEKKHEELEEKVKKLQSERDEMQGKIDMLNIKQANKREGNIRKQRAQEMIRDAQEERTKLWKELTKLSSARAEIIPVTAISYGVKIANTYIKEGFARGVIGIDEVMTQTKAFWKKATGKDLTEDELASIRKEIEPTLTFGNIKISHNWIKDLVQQGFNTIEKLVPEVMKELKKQYPDITERQVRDLITGYGKLVNPSKDEINTLIRKIKRFGRLKSVIEDLHNKKRPLKSGLQRDKPGVQERGIMREIRELLKDVPVDEITESNQLKTALDAKKTRLKNRIEDLNDALKKGKKIVNKEKSLTDEQIEELTALRDLNQAIYDEVFKDDKTEQRINRLIKGYETAIEKLRYRIENLGQEIVTARKDEVKDPIVKEMKERLDNLLKFYNDMREDSGLAELDRLDNLISNAEKITKKYEEKIKNGDFSRRVMKPSYLGVETGVYQAQLDELKERLKYAENKIEAQKEIDTLTKFIAKLGELQKAQTERENVRDEFIKEQTKNELNNRDKWEKYLDNFLDAATIPRLLNAGFEFSSALIQGGIYTMHFLKQDIISAIRGVVTGKKQEYQTTDNFKQMFQSFWKQESHDINLSKLKLNEAWRRAKQSKLAVHDGDVKLEARQDDTHAAKIIKELFNKLKIPNAPKKFERSAQMYLTLLRFKRYVQLEEKIRKEGKNFISNPDDYKQAASAINTLTGAASAGPLEGKLMKYLPLFFYSPRMLASVLKTVSPAVFYHFLKLHAKGDPKTKLSVAQKAFVYDFASAVGMQIILMTAFAAMMQSASGDDEDWTVELDPRSSKFMQIRVKGKDGHVTYIDPLGRYRTAIVFQIRVMLGEMKSRNGDINPLGYKNTPTATELGIDFMANKASPTAAPAWYYFSKKVKKDRNTREFYYTDKFGKDLDFPNEVSEKLYPMYFNSIYEMQDVQSPEMAAFGSALGLFGVNTNTYDETPKKK